MKIALLSVFYPFRGGIAQFGARLHRSLEKQNQEVKSFTFTTQYPNFLFPGKTQFVDGNDQADQIKAERILSSVNPLSYSKTSKRIKSFQPDLFISQYWMPFFGAAKGFVHKRLRKKVKSISILHNVIPHEKRFFDNWANRYFLKHIDGFVVMSDAVQADLLSLKPDAKFLRIDHPVYDHFGTKVDQKEAREKLGLADDVKVLLFFGLIRDYKGLDLLLESLAFLPEMHLVVAGEVYGDFKKYQEIIDRLDLKERVHLNLKYIPDEEVSVYFSASDLCVLPYKSATQSGITAIANHFELPIVATDVGGLRDTIEKNNTGIIVDSISADQVAKTVQHFFNQNLSIHLVQGAKELKEKNSWENFAKSVLSFSETL